MERVMVSIGSTYEVLEDYGKYLKKGEKWYAWFYGELILLQVEDNGAKFKTGLELRYRPQDLIKAIKSGKVIELPVQNNKF